MAMPIGSLISAGANLASGFIGQSAAKKANAQNQANFQQQIGLQEDFARKGIRWKVKDAQAAGIHPLFALGASTHSFAPQSISSPTDTSMSSAVANMGQDIGRAVNATRTAGERVDAFTKSAQALTLEKGALENQLLASQIKRLQATANPPMPSGNANSVPGAPTFEEAPRLNLGGGPLKHDPTISNAEDFEKRWGEWGGDAAGLYVAYRDYLANAASMRARLLREGPRAGESFHQFNKRTSRSYRY